MRPSDVPEHEPQRDLAAWLGERQTETDQNEREPCEARLERRGGGQKPAQLSRHRQLRHKKEQLEQCLRAEHRGREVLNDFVSVYIASVVVSTADVYSGIRHLRGRLNLGVHLLFTSSYRSSYSLQVICDTHLGSRNR